jgi:hypothetical protein
MTISINKAMNDGSHGIPGLLSLEFPCTPISARGSCLWNTVDWTLAISLCDNFRRSLPGLIDQNCVDRYHEIIESLEGAGDLHLEDCRIHAGKMSFMSVRSHTADIGAPSGRIHYTSHKYCDSTYFWQKLDQLQQYLSVASKNDR